MGVERTDWDAGFFMVLSIGWIVSMHSHNIRSVVDRLGHQPDIVYMGLAADSNSMAKPKFPAKQ